MVMRTMVRDAWARFSLWFCVVFLALMSSAALASAKELVTPSAQPQPILLYFTGRPPFIWRDDAGVMHGISYQIGEKVFKHAKLPYQWVQAPSARVQHYFTNNKHALCLVNWIYTKRRNELGRISLPTYKEHDYVGVVPKVIEQRFAGRNIQQVLDDQSVVVLYKEGYAYSRVLTNMLNNMNHPKVDYRGDQAHNLRLIASHRADIAFFEEQELKLILKQSPQLADKITVMRYPELNTVATTRHIICSKAVSVAQMDKLNQAIQDLDLVK